MTEPMKGITATILRGNGMDCTADGITNKTANLSSVTIVGTYEEATKRLTPLEQHSQVFEPTPDKPACVIVFRTIGERRLAHVQPLDTTLNGDWHMAGGHYASLGDSRLTALVDFYGALSIHDRIES